MHDVRTIDLLSIEVTSHCNFGCTFCPDGLMARPRGHMDLGLFEKIVAELAEKRERIPVRQMQFNLMGEPTLNPRLVRMGHIANAHGFRPVIVTNGSLLTEEKGQALLGLDLEYLQLSYQTPTRELFAMRQAHKLDFETYRERVLGFLELKVRLGSTMEVWVHMLDNASGYLKGFRMVEGEEREAQIAAFERFAATLADRYGIARGRGALDADTIELLPHVRLFFRDCMDWGHSILPEGISVEPSERGECPLPGFQLGILWNGDVTICCLDYDGKTRLGSVAHQSVEEIWNGEALRTIQADLERGILRERLCRQCRGTLVDARTGAVVANSVKPLPRAIADFLRTYGVRRTLRRGVTELGQRLRRAVAAG